MRIDHTVDPDATREEAAETTEVFDAINDLLEMGLIRMEVDDNGEQRLYPN